MGPNTSFASSNSTYSSLRINAHDSLVVLLGTRRAEQCISLEYPLALSGSPEYAGACAESLVSTYSGAFGGES